MEHERDMLAELLGDTPSRFMSEPVVNETADPATVPPEPIAGVLGESDIAMLLGITSNQVRTKARDGLIVRVAPNRYDVRESLKRYIGRLREHASRAGAPSAVSDELKAQKIRQARHAADRLELQNESARGDLVKSIDVERAWASVLRDVRSTLLAVPSRVGATLPHLTAHDIAQIDREIKTALESLANGN